MLKWGDSLAITDDFVRTGLDENFYRLDVVCSTIAQNHSLDQGCPSKDIDMIQRRAASDEACNDFMLAEMNRSNQGGAAIDAGDKIRLVAQFRPDSPGPGHWPLRQ